MASQRQKRAALASAFVALALAVAVYLNPARDSVQKRIDNECADGGGTIEIQPGERITATLIVPEECEHMTIAGTGMGQRIKIATGITGIRVKANYFTLRDIALQHDADHADNVVLHIARGDNAEIAGPSSWLVDRVRFIGVGDPPNRGIGLALGFAMKGVLQNSHIWGFDRGVLGFNQTNANSIMNTTIAASRIGVDLVDLGSNFDLLNNAFESNQLAVKTSGPSRPGAGILNSFGNHYETHGVTQILRSSGGSSLMSVGDRFSGDVDSDYLKTNSGASKDTLIGAHYLKGIKNQTGDCVNDILPSNSSSAGHTGNVCQ